MAKQKVTIKVTKNGKHGFICSCDHPFKDFDLGGSGDTIAEAKQDCFKFYNEMKEYTNTNLPELEVTWVYDLPSFFKNFDFLNATKVAEYAGMSPSNFRHYTAGSKLITETQLARISEAISSIANELKTSNICV